MNKKSVGTAGRKASRVLAPDRCRVAITMDCEVLEVFKKMAARASISVGRCIGDWCGDTVDGAEFVAAKMLEAKSCPRLVMKEMESLASGLLAETQLVNKKMRRSALDVAASAASGLRRAQGGPPVL